MPHERILYGTPPKKSKHKIPHRIFLVFFIFFLAFGAALWGVIYIFRYPAWQIRHIEVTGTETLDSELLTDALRRELSGHFLFIIPKGSFFVAHTGPLSRTLAGRFLKIQSLSLAKYFPDTLRVRVVERRLWGIFCNNFSSESPETSEENASCAYLDTAGYAFESAPDSQGALIIKIRSDGARPDAGREVVPSHAAQKMQDAARGLRERFGVEVIGYELISKLPSEFRVLTDGGFRIYFNFDDDLENTFRVLKALWEEEVRDKKDRLLYIDARFGNKVFYKLRQ